MGKIDGLLGKADHKTDAVVDFDNAMIGKPKEIINQGQIIGQFLGVDAALLWHYIMFRVC